MIQRKKMLSILMSLTLAAGTLSTGLAETKAYADEPEVAAEYVGSEVSDVPEVMEENEEPQAADKSEAADNPEAGTDTSEAEEQAVPEEPRQAAFSSVTEEVKCVAVNTTVKIDTSDYDFMYGGTPVFQMEDGQIASVDGEGNVTGLKEGSTVLHISYLPDDPEEEGSEVLIPIQVTNPAIKRTTYTIFRDQYDNPWEYPSVKVPVSGISKNSEFDYESPGGEAVDSTHLLEGYLVIYASESVKIKITIDGKEFTVTIKVLKAELESSNKLSKYLGSIVTYKGKKDTLTLRINGKKASARSWKSTNTSVAKVDKSGKVTGGKNTGRAYIRAYLDEKTYLEYLVECTYKGAYQAVSNGFHDLEYGDGGKYKKIKYSQAKRMSKGYRDCSSFVYRCYCDPKLKRKIFDIGNVGGYWATNASAQARWLKSKGKTVANKIVDAKKLLPGDTMYTRGPQKNGEWRNIYHAFLYVGNGYVITTWYSDGKKKTLAMQPYTYDGSNVVYIGRPLKPKKTTKK